MKTTVVLFTSAVMGMLMGAALLFLSVVGTIAWAYWGHEGKASLPGIFDAVVYTCNDAPAVEFAPHGPGMLVMILVIAALQVVATAARLAAVHRAG